MTEEFDAMALHESCEIYLEQLVVVRPSCHGWGWWLAESSDEDDDVGAPRGRDEGPDPFRLRIQDFLYLEDEMVGGVGVIEQPGHIFNGMQVIFEISNTLVCANFTDKVTHFDIEIGMGLYFGENEEPEFPDGSPIVYGPGYVGASLKSINSNISRLAKRVKYEKAEQ